MSTLNIVLKTVERCNLNCSYCYFFNGFDQTYLKRPKYITKEVIKHLTRFLREGINRLDLKNIHIVLHGGEPLMQPKGDFIYLMETLKSSDLNANLSFSIQTNATLVTSSWIDLFNRYEIGVGVSIDGPREYHNKYRVDHYNNGSYEQVVRGIKLLQQELTTEPGCLTVINPEFDGRQIYRHLVDLGVKKIDFLLPDNNHSNPPTYKIREYANYLIKVFDQWVKDNDSEISIQKFKSIILQLLGKPSLIYGFGRNNTSDSIPLLAVRSDGKICPTDELISTDPETTTLTGKNVCNTTLQEIISHKIFEEIAIASGIIPSKCSGCCWYKACGAGNLLGRYSKENRFSNHSVYCSTFQELYAHIASYLINSGVAPPLIIYLTMILKLLMLIRSKISLSIASIIVMLFFISTCLADIHYHIQHHGDRVYVKAEFREYRANEPIALYIPSKVWGINYEKQIKNIKVCNGSLNIQDSTAILDKDGILKVEYELVNISKAELISTFANRYYHFFDEQRFYLLGIGSLIYPKEYEENDEQENVVINLNSTAKKIVYNFAPYFDSLPVNLPFKKLQDIIILGNTDFYFHYDKAGDITLLVWSSDQALGERVANIVTNTLAKHKKFWGDREIMPLVLSIPNPFLAKRNSWGAMVIKDS